MNRVTRMAIGLVALIPVLALAGWLISVLSIEGEAGAWTVFGAGLVWVAVMIWWALRGPAPTQLSDEERPRYLAFLRQAEYRPLDRSDDARSDRR